MDATAPALALQPGAAPPATTVGAAPLAAVAGTTVAPPASATSSGPSLAGPVAAGLVLAALAAAALLAARRRRRAPRLVEIVESASLGPKRSLVVARMGEELLLLGASEGGIALLASRQAPAGAPATAGAVAPAGPTAAAPAAAGPFGLDPAVLGAGLVARLRRRAQAAAPVAAANRFDALLAESGEDAELRRKLAAGQVGSVR